MCTLYICVFRTTLSDEQNSKDLKTLRSSFQIGIIKASTLVNGCTVSLCFALAGRESASSSDVVQEKSLLARSDFSPRRQGFAVCNLQARTAIIPISDNFVGNVRVG